MSGGDRVGLLGRLALHRSDLRAWALYDVASSAFATTVITAVFPIHFVQVIAADLPRGSATALYSVATSAALLVCAVLGPILGRAADRLGRKRSFLAGSVALGVGATAGLAAVGRGEVAAALILFALANLGYLLGTVFYDAMLRDLTADDQVHQASATGTALGYLGGGVLLAVQLLCIARPAAFGLSGPGQAVRLSLASVALWWAVLSIPLLRREPAPGGAAGARRGGLAGTWRELRSHRDALRFLVAFLIYNDGISTIARMATAYGAELGLPRNDLIAAILIVQIVGVPCTIAFGQLARRFGPKPCLYACLTAYVGVLLIAYAMTQAWQFFAVAALVGAIQGGCLSLSRSLFASLIPRRDSAVFFGLFSGTARLAALLGPLCFAASAALTGSSRSASLAMIALFVAGALLLRRVDAAAGQPLAGSAEATPALEP